MEWLANVSPSNTHYPYPRDPLLRLTLQCVTPVALFNDHHTRRDGPLFLYHPDDGL